ncbi:MAG TPA: hypothetical protein VKR24_06765, partial [Candidatus Limnocylindrales bacterium]|nr:hypothetical protein [Candidatus Limnocylindrales bacterium]
MELARSVFVGLIVAGLLGCNAQSSSGPGASVSPGPSNLLEDPAIDSSRLPGMTTQEACDLLTAGEASTILGKPLEGTPGGISDPGDHALCVYETASTMALGTFIKVELNRIGFAGEATLVNLHRGAHTLDVGGFEAIGADAETDPAVEDAVLSVKLAKASADPAL